MGLSRTRVAQVIFVITLAFGLHVSSAHAGLTKRTAAPSKKVVVVKRKVAKAPVVSRRKTVIRAVAMPPKPSFGQLAGLHTGSDALDLRSSVALVIDQETQEVLFSKNDAAVLRPTQKARGTKTSPARLQFWTLAPRGGLQSL